MRYRLLIWMISAPIMIVVEYPTAEELQAAAERLESSTGWLTVYYRHTEGLEVRQRIQIHNVSNYTTEVRQ